MRIKGKLTEEELLLYPEGEALPVKVFTRVATVDAVSVRAWVAPAVFERVEESERSEVVDADGDTAGDRVRVAVRVRDAVPAEVCVLDAEDVLLVVVDADPESVGDSVAESVG